MFTQPRLDSNSGHPPSLEVPACKLGDEPQSTKGYKKADASGEFLFFVFRITFYFYY